MQVFIFPLMTDDFCMTINQAGDSGMIIDLCSRFEPKCSIMVP